MLFEARELKPYAEPITANAIKEGEVYFAVQFLDEDLLIPTVEPLLFLGRNLTVGDEDRLYFQSVESHQQGIRFDSASEEERAAFPVQTPQSINHIVEYERALDVLMSCALSRREKPAQRS